MTEKIYTYIHHPIRTAGALLSVVLSFGLIAVGAHAKDVAAYAWDQPHGTGIALEAAKKTESASHSQLSAKVSAELHNHIEKQTMNSMVKSMSDDTKREGSRQFRRAVRNAKKLAEKEEKYIEPMTESLRHLWQRALGLV